MSKTHHLLSYVNICKYYQHGKPENELTESIDHGT